MIFFFFFYTERAKLLKASGVIAKYHPEAITSAKSREIFERVMNDFDERVSIFNFYQLLKLIKHKNLI